MFSSLISFHTFDTNILPFLLRTFLLFILHIRQFAEIIAGEESVLLFIWFSWLFTNNRISDTLISSSSESVSSLTSQSWDSSVLSNAKASGGLLALHDRGQCKGGEDQAVHHGSIKPDSVHSNLRHRALCPWLVLLLLSGSCHGHGEPPHAGVSVSFILKSEKSKEIIKRFTSWGRAVPSSD